MIIPAVRIVISHDDRRAAPERRCHNRVHDVHNKGLLIERIRVTGMSILIRRGLQIANVRKIACAQSVKEIVRVVLMICRIGPRCPRSRGFVGRVWAGLIVLA